MMIASLILAAGENPLGHVVDTPRYGAGSFWLISDVTIMLAITAILLCVFIPLAASKIRTGKGAKTTEDFRTRGLWANMVESVCVYLRDEVFKPLLKDDADKFAPLLWTFFWFILVCNLFGLIPLRDITGLIQGLTGTPWQDIHGIGGTATQSIFVTAALAVIAFLFINGTALARDPGGYFKHMTGGAPVAMWPIMIPVEILGTFVKPFALAMRLFANMTGGHIVVAVMLMFVKMLVDNLHGFGYALSILPIGAAIGIYFLEVLVAFIQAFVFTFLVALFLGQLIVHEHNHDDHGHSVDHDAKHDKMAEPAITNSQSPGHVAAALKH